MYFGELIRNSLATLPLPRPSTLFLPSHFHTTGCLRRRMRDEARPRRHSGGLWQREWQGLLDREELVGYQMGRGRLHPHEAQRGHAHGQVRHRHGYLLPGQESPQGVQDCTVCAGARDGSGVNMQVIHVIREMPLAINCLIH